LQVPRGARAKRCREGSSAAAQQRRTRSTYHPFGRFGDNGDRRIHRRLVRLCPGAEPRGARRGPGASGGGNGDDRADLSGAGLPVLPGSPARSRRRDLGLLVGLSWRWISVINLPIGIAALAAGVFLLPEVREPRGTRLPDRLSVVALLGAVGLTVLGTVQGPEWGWGDRRVIGIFVLATLAAALEVQRTSRANSPVIERRLSRAPRSARRASRSSCSTWGSPSSSSEAPSTCRRHGTFPPSTPESGSPRVRSSPSSSPSPPARFSVGSAAPCPRSSEPP
jgi:hypothetical protein